MGLFTVTHEECGFWSVSAISLDDLYNKTQTYNNQGDGEKSTAGFWHPETSGNSQRLVYKTDEP